jgi:hypothetical protein
MNLGVIDWMYLRKKRYKFHKENPLDRPNSYDRMNLLAHANFIYSDYNEINRKKPCHGTAFQEHKHAPLTPSKIT